MMVEGKKENKMFLGGIQIFSGKKALYYNVVFITKHINVKQIYPPVILSTMGLKTEDKVCVGCSLHLISHMYSQIFAVMIRQTYFVLLQLK